MKRFGERLLYRLMLIAAIVLLPFWYLRIRLTGDDPGDYFLRRLTTGKNRFTRPIFRFLVLSQAARNYDAPMALQALRSLESPPPCWALSKRHIKLLLEAPLWLGELRDFQAIRLALSQWPGASPEFHELLANYDAVARCDTGATGTLLAGLALPALHWERLATELHMQGRIEESGHALYQALCFLPEVDPRRNELIARLLQVNVADEASPWSLDYGSPGSDVAGHRG